MSNLKEHITASYGASMHQKTLKLKEAKKNIAKTKNQYIFLQRCVKHKLIPKSLRIGCPIKSLWAKKVVERYRMELLITTKNDAKHRYFKSLLTAKNIQEELSTILSREDIVLINTVTEKSREAMFIRSRERLVKKFNILLGLNETGREGKRNICVKTPILNLVPDDIPESHRELLSLGPKFVPHTKNIPYMDIISVTESSALKLEYGKKVCQAQVLRKDVLRILKTAKPVKDNLTRSQRTAIKEIKNDSDIKIYPFDKGSGLVRIKNKDAITKIREQIGDTEIIDEDPTEAFARYIRKTLGLK